MVLRWSEDRGQPRCSIAVAGHRLSFVLPEALDFESEPSRVRSWRAGRGSGWRLAKARLDPLRSLAISGATLTARRLRPQNRPTRCREVNGPWCSGSGATEAATRPLL